MVNILLCSLCQPSALVHNVSIVLGLCWS